MNHIKSIQSVDVGGLNTVDIVELADGRFLGINEECVMLYASWEEFWEASGQVDYKTIDLTAD
jgi:hypothetical protein